MAKCPKCGFAPKSDEEKAKSLILSLNYEIGDVYKGQTKERLLEISDLIKQNRFEFDKAEVNEVIAYAHKVLSTPTTVFLKDAVRWLLWPSIVFALIICVLIWSRH